MAYILLNDYKEDKYNGIICLLNLNRLFFKFESLCLVHTIKSRTNMCRAHTLRYEREKQIKLRNFQ